MEIMNVIIEMINAFLHMYIAFIFCSSFGKLQSKRYIAIATVLLCSVLLTISLLFLKGNILIYIPMTILTFSLSVLFNIKLGNKILYTILYLVIPGVVEMLVGFGISAIFKISIDIAKDNTAYYISGMLLSKLIVFLIVLFIRISKGNSLLQHYKNYYLSIFIFPASTLAVAIVQHKIFLEYPDQDMLTKYWVLISYTILIVANIIVFDFINTIYENATKENKIRRANEIIDNQTVQYQALIDNNKNIMQLRHDHKNFCIGLVAELESGNIETVIDKLKKEYDISRYDYLVESDIIHTIINSKRKLASTHDIHLDLNCTHLNPINICPTDLAIILGNALDNAIEASKGLKDYTKKVIKISVNEKNNMIFLNIKNHVEKPIDITNMSTTKKVKNENHGFGIIGMKQIALKYSGEVMFSCEDNIFTTRIILDNQKIHSNVYAL